MNYTPPSHPSVERCAISWSAGKDSWLALMREREAGHRIETFVTMCDADGASKSHALAPALVEAQVRALGGTPMPVRVEDAPGSAHRDWLAPACARAGLVARFPLWGDPLRVRSLARRRVPSRPPFAPTEFVVDVLEAASESVR